MKPLLWGWTTFLVVVVVAGAVLNNSSHRRVDPLAASSAPDFGVSSFGAPRVLDPASMGESWRQFRGSGAAGVSKRADLPVEWSATKNILWDLTLPGTGASSPVACLQRVYVTSSSGYGESFTDSGDLKKLRHHVHCIDAQTGKPIWTADVEGSPLTQKLNHEILEHGFASSSPVTDGANVYAFFGASGVYKFGPRGKAIWKADVGMEHSKFGSAASLVLYGDALIVNASAESESVYAIDKDTGKGLWRITDVKNSWSTPIIAKNNEGNSELIVQDDGRLRGFDPGTGKLLWTFRGPKGYASSTPIATNGFCFFTAGASRTLSAIKIGGKGDVTKTHSIWSTNNVCRHTSPVYVTGNLFAVSESGIVRCFDAKTGKRLNAKRIDLDGGRVYSSPVVIGSNLYVPTGSNRFMICRANSKLDFYRDNQIDDQRVLATVCPSSNSLLIRAGERLICVLSKARATAKLSIPKISEPPLEGFARFESDSTGRPKSFVKVLSRDPKVRNQAILGPIQQQLDYQALSEARVWLAKNGENLNQYREQHRMIYWGQLAGTIVDASMTSRRKAQLESLVMDEAEQLRGRILAEAQSKTVVLRK